MSDATVTAPEGAARWRDEAFRVYCEWRGYGLPADSGITVADLASEHRVLVARLATFAEAQYQAGLSAAGPLAQFGARVIEVFREGRHGDLDGWEVQEWAVATGVLEPRVVTEPCGDDCDCEPGDTCYWLTEATQRALAALRGEPRTPEGA